MGAAHCTELPNEQPRSTDSFPQTAYLISNKMVNLKENVVQKLTGLSLVWRSESEISVEVVMIFTFRSLILLSYFWKFITWLFISIFIRDHNFFVADAKFTLSNYWQVALNYKSAILIQIMLINKITKNWFNGTPIYNSERDDKEHTERQKICFDPSSKPAVHKWQCSGLLHVLLLT